MWECVQQTVSPSGGCRWLEAPLILLTCKVMHERSSAFKVRAQPILQGSAAFPSAMNQQTAKILIMQRETDGASDDFFFSAHGICFGRRRRHRRQHGTA